jgi:hypothetical protein
MPMQPGIYLYNMATIPTGQKFHTVPSNVQTVERGSALANSQREIYTMQDIVDTVSTAVSSNPQVIDLKVTNGTVVTGTTNAAISQTLLIPANTFTAEGGMLEFMARYQKSAGAGNHSCSVFINTAPNFTGATIIASYTLGGGGGGGSNITIQGIRTARIASNTLTIYPANTSGITDYVGTALAQTSVAFNPTVDNYLLFAITLSISTESSVVEMARATKYE